ncbi:12237_t:CDS:2, partial [Gigaspora rosea]
MEREWNSRSSEPKDENSREGEEAYVHNIRSVSRKNSCSIKTWTDHRTLHTVGSNRSKTGIKNNSVHSKKWNLKHEEVSGSTNEEIKETLLPCSRQREGGSPTLLKVATGVNKGFCETEVSQAQTMSQNKKGQYKILEEKDMLDIHKATNPNKRITTWVGRGSETKIDYIWVSKSWNNSIFSCKVNDADQITAKEQQETLPKKKRVPELQELQVEDKNLRMLKKDIRRIAKWCSKIKKFKFQETEDSELDLFILEEGAKGLLEDLRSKHSEANIEGET